MIEAEHIARRLNEALGEEARLLVSPLDGTPADLLPAELELIERSVDKRRREVATGRRCARALLGALGFPEAPLLRGPDRVPLWPEGATGSISHSDDLCIVAVARSREIPALGVDVEAGTPLEERLWDLVLRPRERAWLAEQPPAEQGRLAKLFFSVKECAYKCQYTLTRRALEFGEVEVELDLSAEHFSAQLLPLSPALVEGAFHRGDRWIASGARGRPLGP